MMPGGAMAGWGGARPPMIPPGHGPAGGPWGAVPGARGASSERETTVVVASHTGRWLRARRRRSPGRRAESEMECRAGDTGSSTP